MQNFSNRVLPQFLLALLTYTAGGTDHILLALNNRALPRNFGKMTFQRNWEKCKRVMAQSTREMLSQWRGPWGAKAPWQGPRAKPMLRPRSEAPAITRGLRIASLGLLNIGRVLENKQIIKSLRKITRRSSIFRKLCYSRKGLTHPNKNDKTILFIYMYF